MREDSEVCLFSMTTTHTPTFMKRASCTWRRWRESVVLSPWFGTSWRRLHSPTLFGWAKALQSNHNHWPTRLKTPVWRVDPASIEAWRLELLSDASCISRKDLGAGSRLNPNKASAIPTRKLARRSLTPQRDVLALCRWLRCISEAGRFLELGTSLGVTSAYAASVGWRVETWEGCAETLMKAKDGWRRLGLEDRISALRGSFHSQLEALTSEQRWDVVYIDGCHEEQATIDMVRALEKHVGVCIVVDDIAWSPGMHCAWETLKQLPEWRVSFSWRGRGFLLKAPHMTPQHLRLA